MKFTLKDYQEDAVDDVLNSLERARTAWERDGKETSLALTAPTGAGKTVMAAAVIESLFYGSDKFDVDPDEGAVVLWFSDDPNLNEQTRMRLMDASEKFTSSDLLVIEPPFAQPKLDPGKVYFLNTQKLSKTSKLTRGHVDDESHLDLAEVGTPDLQGYTIWETIANTINDDGRTLLPRPRRSTSRIQHEDEPRQADARPSPRAGARWLSGGADRVGNLRDDRALQHCDERSGRVGGTPRVLACHGRSRARAGLGSREGRCQSEHP